MKLRSLGSIVLLSTLALGSVAAFAEASQVEDPLQRQQERWGANNPGDPYTAHQLGNQGLSGYYGYYGNYPGYALSQVIPQNVVRNWRAYNLSRPPAGYHWIQIGNQFQLQPR